MKLGRYRQPYPRRSRIIWIAIKLFHLSWKVVIMAERTVVTKRTATPVILTPSAVEKMLAERQAVQVVKFRTTCTDCLPNF